MSNFTAPRVNNNGDTSKALMRQYQDVVTAVDVLAEAMAKAAPHGRNYQTMDCDETFYESREAWQKMQADMWQIHSVCQDAMVNIFRQNHER